MSALLTFARFDALYFLRLWNPFAAAAQYLERSDLSDSYWTELQSVSIDVAWPISDAGPSVTAIVGAPRPDDYCVTCN